MKYQKKSILVFCLFWVVGLVGGYYLGVGSAVLPTESVEYNYYFSEKTNDSTVEPITHDCQDDEEEDSRFIQVIKDLKLFSVPKKVIQKLLSPSACTKHENKKVACTEIV